MKRAGFVPQGGQGEAAASPPEDGEDVVINPRPKLLSVDVKHRIRCSLGTARKRVESMDNDKKGIEEYWLG